MMKVDRLAIAIAAAFALCRLVNADDDSSQDALAMYKLVINDLALKKAPSKKFVGSDIWVSQNFCKGNSLLYSWNRDLKIDDDLVSALRSANTETVGFPTNGFGNTTAKVLKIESFHDLHYYGKGAKQVDAKCLVEFWQAGISKDGRRAIARFLYGPSSHGAVGTYIFKRTESGWQIVTSTIDYYL